MLSLFREKAGAQILFCQRPINFHVKKYYGSSFLNHCNIAKDRNCSFHVYDSFLPEHRYR
ncbi:MAG: hypothetical protein R2741_13820 [Methanolobus sp.]